VLPECLDPALDRDQLDVRRRVLEPLPDEVRDRHRLDGDALHAGARDELRPAILERVVALEQA